MKVDTSGIEGFEGMTAEQKLAAVLALEVPDKVDLSGYVPKAQADKSAAEAANYKKQLAAKMTDDEAAAAAKAQELSDMQAKIAELEQANQKLMQAQTEASYKAKYLALPGFDEKLAEETAKAMAAGDMDKVFANQQKANEAYEKQIKADLLKSTPKPSGEQNTDGEHSEALELAKRLGKGRASSQQATENVLKHYM